MPINYNTPTKQARMQDVVSNIDAGAGPGRLELCTAGYALVLASVELAKPSGTVVGDTLTMSGFPRSDPTADASGTAAVARVVDSTGTVVGDGLTVGTAGTDIVLGSVEITAGNEVRIDSFVITHG